MQHLKRHKSTYFALAIFVATYVELAQESWYVAEYEPGDPMQYLKEHRAQFIALGVFAMTYASLAPRFVSR